MRVRLIIFGFLVGVLYSESSSGQLMTKQEILKTWKIFRTDQPIDSLFRFNVELQTRTVLDTLLQNGVDTLVLYSIRYPGSVALGGDSCLTTYPIYSYFFLQHNGVKLIRKVSGKCDYKKERPATPGVFQFLSNNYSYIKDDFFMDAVYGASKDGDHIKIKGNYINHEPKYALFVMLGDRYKYLTFSDSALNDKQGMFYDDNNKLSSLELVRLIKAEISEE